MIATVGDEMPVRESAIKNDAPVKPASPTGKKATVYILIAIAIGLTTNIFMGLLMDSSKIWKTISTVSLWVIIIPFVAYNGISIVDSVRLYLVGRKCGYKLSFATCVLNSMVGSFFAHITPLAMGGQPFQIYHLYRHGVSNKISTNIILSRFVVNAMLLVIILLLGIPIVMSISRSIAGAAVVFYIGLATTFMFAILFLLVLIQPRIISWISSLLARTWIGRLIGKLTRKPLWQREFEQYTKDLRSEVHFLWSEGLGTMLFDIFLNILNLGLHGFAIWYPLHELVSADLTYLQVMVTYIAVWQVVMYIPSPGASGGLEGMFTIIFSSMSGHAEMTLVAIVIWRFSTYYLSLIPGLILSSIAMKQGVRVTPRFD